MGATSYAGGAVAAQLSGNINNSATSFQVTATTGWPNTAVGPFVIKVDPGLVSEEKMLVSAYDGSGNLTITQRGYDGTSAASHTTGTYPQGGVQPCWDAVSAQDNNNHVYVTSRNDHTQYLTATSLSGGSNYHDKTARHAFGAAYGTPGTPTSIYNTSGSAGSASGPARSDHVHLGIPLAGGSGLLLQSTGTGAGNVSWLSPTYGTIDGTTGDIVAIAQAGNTAAAGSVGESADAGHTHGYLGEFNGYHTYTTSSAPAAGDVALYYGLAATPTCTLPALAGVAIGQSNYVINTNGTHTVAVVANGSEGIINLSSNGSSGGTQYVNANTAARFMKINSTTWVQVE